MPGDSNAKTVAALQEFCDYLVDRGYASKTQVEPWKIAIRKVVSIVEGTEDIGAIDLDVINTDDYMGRFEVKARLDYKHGSRAAYVRRVRNAIEAFEHFATHGKPPTFRQPGKREKPTPQATPAPVPSEPSVPNEPFSGRSEPENGMLDYVFPLRSGKIARLQLPPVLEKEDGERLVLFLRALQFEPQRQIPEHTGDELAKVA